MYFEFEEVVSLACSRLEAWRTLGAPGRVDLLIRGAGRRCKAEGWEEELWFGFEHVCCDG